MTKENSDICEIYRIGNLINNKFYIGQTIMGVKARFRGHKCLTADGCIKLFNAMECYGRENFYIEAIVSAVPGLNQIEIDILENMLIDQYDAIKNGYNVRHGGSHGKLSEETKRKISQSRIGKFSGENAGFYNHHHTEENKIILSELTKARVQGENNPFYGKHHTEETKQKLSEIRIESGQSVGENNGMFGREHTVESKNKISQTKNERCLGYS